VYIYVIYGLFLVEIGIEIENFGLVYISFTLLGILGGFTAGKMVDRFGEKYLVILGMVFVVISIGLVWLLPGLWAIIGIVILSFFYYLTDTIIKVQLNRRLEPQHRSSIFSFANLVSSIFLALSRPFVGYISDSFTSRTGFFSWFLVGIPILVILLILYLQIPTKKEI
jgi:MFS family permease